ACGAAQLVQVAYGDLGLTRNHAAQLAQGRFLSFLDGDDLWGTAWLRLAFQAANAEPEEARTIWHPQAMFLFNESDFDRTSFDRTPHPQSYALYLLHQASDAPSFDPRSLFLENMWGAVAFARRGTYLQFPYRAVDRQAGFGIEDW